MKKADLMKERAAHIEAQKRLHDAAAKETRSLNDAETAEFRELQGKIEALNEKIKDAEAYEENLRSIAEGGEQRGNNPASRSRMNDGQDPEQREKGKIFKRFDIGKAIRSVMPGGSGLDGVEKEVHEMGLEEHRAAKVGDEIEANTFSLPMSYLRAAQQTVSQDGGAYGGALVHDQAPRIVDPLRPRLFLEDLGATFLPNLTGGSLSLPVAADFTMEWLAEGATGSTQKKTYEGPKLSPKRAFGAVSVTNRLLMQSSVDAQNLIMTGLRRGFTNLLQTAALNGAGGVAPTGILNWSGVNVAAGSSAAAATWAKIVELQGLIEEDDATETSLGYVIHPKVKAALKQITKDAGSGRFLLENDSIDGVKFVSTSLVPVGDASGTPVYPIVYGDWSQLFIGQWGAVNIKVNPYSEDLADSVRLTLNTYADTAIANPKAFAKNAFISV